MKTLNKEIARKCFMSLVLDYDIPADEYGPAYISCRVLNDQNYFGCIVAGSIEEAVKKFMAGDIDTKTSCY